MRPKVPSTSATVRQTMKPVRKTWMLHRFRTVCWSAFTLCRPKHGTLKEKDRTLENDVRYIVPGNLEPVLYLLRGLLCARFVAYRLTLFEISLRGGPAVQRRCRTALSYIDIFGASCDSSIDLLSELTISSLLPTVFHRWKSAWASHGAMVQRSCVEQDSESDESPPFVSLRSAILDG